MTHEIRHSFFIGAPAERVMAALMDQEHIRNWWTREAQVVDGKGSFGWSGYGWNVELDMEQHTTPAHVLWKCTGSNMQNTRAWEGTTMSFLLVPEADGTRVEFAQTDYEGSPCFDACDQGWAYFLGTSLKQYLETGKGMPYPEMQDTSADPPEHG